MKKMHGWLFLGILFFLAASSCWSCDQQTQADRLINAADKIIGDSFSLNSAEGNYREAGRLCPEDSRVHHGLAKIAWIHHDWAAATEHYRKAFELTGTSSAKFAYSVGVTYEYQKKYGEAIEFLEKAKGLIEKEKDAESEDLLRNTLYDLADAHLRAFVGAPRGAGADDHYDHARNIFGEYLSKNPKVRTWAHYNLACLDALRASSKDLSPAEQDRLAGSVVESLRTALKELSADASSGRSGGHYRVRLMRQTLLESSDILRDASDPIRCEALHGVLEKRRPGEWKEVKSLASQLPESILN